MKNRVHGMFVSLFLTSLFVLNLQPEIVHAQTTAFGYQGQLANNGVPVSGTYNLTFSLFNVASGGSAVAGPVVTNGVVVTNGLFYVKIDFGAGPWEGQTNWLQIGVETNGAASFTTVAPRQEVLPVPYAIVANDASNLLGTLPATQLSGALPLAQLPAGVVTNNESSGVTLDNLTLNGTLNLPAAPVIINSGGTLLLYAEYYNFFAGLYAGNLTMSGNYNTAIGYQALHFDTSGYYNTADGAYALYLNTNGVYNTANGACALFLNTSGSENTANGAMALWFSSSGSENTADGTGTLLYNTSGSDNTAGGDSALYNNTTGFNNTADGALALWNSTTGTNNIAIGYKAGENFTNNESANIDIGNFGVTGESGVIRIGTPGIQTAAYIAGSLTVYGTLNLPAAPVTINSGTNLLLYADANLNFFSGRNAGNLTTSGIGNTAVGSAALQNNTSGSSDTANGNAALYLNTSGSFNMGDGAGALYFNRSGNFNTAAGWGALQNIGLGNGSGGTNNIALGYNAGSSFTENESSNIDIGNTGTPGENGVIRIGTPGIQTATYLSGTVYANGVALTSDRNAKENFAAVNAQAVLDKVVALPVSEWNYKSDKEAEHIGPMAQDFHAAFGLDGTDDKHISVVDENGVALAAIKGLNEKLEAQNAELKRRLDELETQVKTLSLKR